MINVIVSYTVKPEFVSENKNNIQKFLNDFKNLDQTKFEYNVFVKEDGVTFVHFSNYENEEVQNMVLKYSVLQRISKITRRKRIE